MYCTQTCLFVWIYITQSWSFDIGHLNGPLLKMCFIVVQVSAYTKLGPGDRRVWACDSGAVWKLPTGQIQGPAPCWSEYHAARLLTVGNVFVAGWHLERVKGIYLEVCCKSIHSHTFIADKISTHGYLDCQHSRTERYHPHFYNLNIPSHISM